MMSNVVLIENLKKTFGDFVAVDSISLTIRKGEIFGFLGPNGAGKSTTMKMLCGILAPTSGKGSVNGFDIITEQAGIKQSIGYMSQRFSLYEDLTVRENLEFYGTVYGIAGKDLKMGIDRVLDFLEIGPLLDEMVKSLPGGMKQRLSLGAAILHDPPILFLDEPTSGVDPLMRRNFWDLIYNFSNDGKTVFVTTHYMDEAEHCSRIALIIAGRIMAVDSPDNLKTSLPYDVYLLRVEDFLKAFELMQSAEYIKESAIFGSDIHILSDARSGAFNKIKLQLRNNGIRTFTLERIKPSLEDVFVSHVTESRK